MSRGSATLVLIILAAIAIFLLKEAIPAINKDTVNFLTYKGWAPDDIPSQFGIAALLYGTVITSVLALHHGHAGRGRRRSVADAATRPVGWPGRSAI